MPPRPHTSLSLKGQLMKSLCSSFRYNSRNMENPWYGLWALELQRIMEPFQNIVVVPQYALWFTVPPEEPEVEDIGDIDEDAVSEDEEGDEDTEGEETNQDESEDELDCFRDMDENAEPIEHPHVEEPEQDPHVEEPEQDPDTSIALSLITIPDASAAERFPDFVALHILAKSLKYPTNSLLRQRYERRAGLRIIHECCPLVMEVKPFPHRRMNPGRTRKEVLSRLGDAKQNLGVQCYHLFKKYKHALRTIAVATSGDHWTHMIVLRTQVPRGAGDDLDTEVWDSLVFPRPVVLGTPASDLRINQITAYLHAKKPDQQPT